VRRLTRTYAPAVDLEVRGSERIVAGIAVPFDTPATVREGRSQYREIVARGAFRRTIAERGAERVKLLVNHDSVAAPIGRATLLREDAAGLYAEFRVSMTRAGDEAITLAADGALDSFSIGFMPVRNEYRGDLTIRTECALKEVSLVAFPVFEGARVTSVRAIPRSTET
jgi:HK97 family phage prohead protease